MFRITYGTPLTELETDSNDLVIPEVLVRTTDIKNDIIDLTEEKQEKKSTRVVLDSSDNVYVFNCPHCDMFVQVEKNQVNCHIFRHAYLVNKLSNGQIQLLGQIGPHTPKAQCDQLIKEERIVGCGRPFKFVKQDNGEYRAEICGYI